MKKKKFLILVTFIAGLCSIIYELLISTVSSYFLGNSIQQFSLIIGFYMAFMGVGAYFSKFFQKHLLYHFVVIELVLGFVGAFSVPLCYLYFLYADFDGFNLFVLFLVACIGTLTGLEVPLLTRILEKDFSLKDNISNILTFDYLGALIATIAFPFILVPFVGVYKSSLLFGMLNIFLGLLTFVFFREEIELSKLKKRVLYSVSAMMLVLITFSLFSAKQIMDRWHRGIFKHPVVYSEESSYQDIIVTKIPNEFRLYLNGAIQFSSRDEHRYHESLVHLAMMQHNEPNRVLLLGGGEGLAVREVLKYPNVKVDLVELDPSITKLSSEMSLFSELNEGALKSSQVTIHNEDAFIFLLNSSKKYDVIISDLPDPTTETLAKLYSNSFYTLVQNNLEKGGVFVTQATSPTLTPDAFWCIDTTLKHSGFAHTLPYHLNVPSFGDWGFIMASQNPLEVRFDSSIPCKYLEKEAFTSMTYFPMDIERKITEPNYLDQPVIFDYYLEHWQSLNYETK